MPPDHDASAVAPQDCAFAHAEPRATVLPREQQPQLNAMRVVYLAHPLGFDPAERQRNRANAARWVAWATLVHRVAVVADWITLSGELSEDHREFGLACDLALIERCDEVWLCGGRVSPGMALERDHAVKHDKRVWDLTWLGYDAPPSAEVSHA